MSPGRGYAITARMMRTALATLLYFCAVFGAGFVMGPIRALFLEPQFGPLIAVSIEAPILLIAIILAAKWAPAAAGAPTQPVAVIVIGLGALALQQIADVAVGVLMRGMTVTEVYGQFARPDGWVYAALLVVFAVMPWLRGRRN
ncbi:MAG: hypothetical protein K2Y05_02905 [Hyphomicrobiaceae bacterium]|nr:hypothetical protein [Hyphomicrobiaceae bacterium]